MSGAPHEQAALFDHPLAAAVVAVVGKRGYRDATVADFLVEAGVRREEFDRLFAGKDDAVLRVFEAYTANFKRRITAAFESEPSWPDNLRAAAYATAAGFATMTTPRSSGWSRRWGRGRW